MTRPARPHYRLLRPARADVAEPSLDPAQRAVLEHAGGPLLVLAGPGTGKTTTLVETAVARVRAGVAVEHILMVTFSRRAAAEMRERVTARLAQPCASRSRAPCTPTRSGCSGWPPSPRPPGAQAARRRRAGRGHPRPAQALRHRMARRAAPGAADRRLRDPTPRPTDARGRARPGRLGNCTSSACVAAGPTGSPPQRSCASTRP